MKSAWDTLHPGRQWAEKVKRPNVKSAAEIGKAVINYLKRWPEGA